MYTVSAAQSVNPFEGHYTWGGIVAFIVAAATLTAAWALLNRLTPWNDHEEMFERGNVGFTIIRALQVVGLAYAVSPVIGYGADHWWQQAVWALVDAIWATVLLVLATLAAGKVIRHVEGGLGAARDTGVQPAIVLGLFYVAFGMVIGSALPGPGDGLLKTLAISLVFTILGVAYITGVYRLVSEYKLFAGPRDPATRRGLGDLVAGGNWAATITAAALVWTFGVVTSSALAGVFTNWLGSILSFLVAAVIMVLLTLLTMWLVDKFVITRETAKGMIEKNQVLPAGVMAAFFVAVAILVSYVVS